MVFFALSSIAGPLLGGWITESIGWRWAFLINIPLGVLAVVAVITLMRLPKKVLAVRPKIDYLGMGLLSAATSAIILTTTWGGSMYAWDSVQIIGLIVGAIVAAVLFVLTELRVKEPIIPMGLFKEKNFVLVTIAAMLISVAMFGAAGYMPAYFQMAVGLGLLGTVSIETPIALICAYMAVIGIGLGGGMQVLTLVVQNTFPHKIVGTATAANNYFRQVGSSLGSAVVGAIFATRLAQLLSEKFPHGMGGSNGMGSLTPSLLASLPDAIRTPIIESYNGALIPIFVYLVPLAIVAFIILFFVTEKPLADEVEHEVSAESLAEGQLTITELDESDVDLVEKRA